MEFPSFDELKSIINDKVSGSEQLLLDLNNYISRCAVIISDPEEFFNELKKYFGSFQNIIWYLDNLLALGDSKDDLINYIKDFNKRNSDSVKSIFDSAFDRLKSSNCLLTLSNSRTVAQIIEKLYMHNSNLKVIVSESRPLFEGKILSEMLISKGIDTELITEAMIAQSVMKCDAAIIGTDKILPDGSIINKVGSLNLAVICKYFSKPFFVVSKKSKRAGGLDFINNRQNRNEIYDGANDRLRINNYYFEIVYADLITEIFTD